MGEIQKINIMIYMFLTVILLLLVVLCYLVYQLIQSGKAREKAEEKFRFLEMKVNNLQLETLESKLNPHLFKNILNSIQSHAYQTYFALDKLAIVPDYILYESQKKFVSPKEKIEFALNLIEINKIKVSPIFALKMKTKISAGEMLYEQRLLAPLISKDLM